MCKTEWWGLALIDDETDEVLMYSGSATAGELQLFLNTWSDDEIIKMRASIYFGRVD